MRDALNQLSYPPKMLIKLQPALNQLSYTSKTGREYSVPWSSDGRRITDTGF
jgi:hypothetical protein